MTDFTANWRVVCISYYLVNVIYVKWSVLMKLICVSSCPNKVLLAQLQEGTQNDVKCVFGTLGDYGMFVVNALSIMHI